MGEADMGREKFFRLRVTEVVSDVGEVSTLGRRGGGHGEGFVE
jgi:hypothetical protein